MDLVEELGKRFTLDSSNSDAPCRCLSAMMYMRTLDEIRSLLPSPYDFSPAAAVQFVQRVSYFLQAEQRPDFAAFE